MMDIHQNKELLGQLLDSIHADLFSCDLASVEQFIFELSKCDFKEVIRWQTRFSASYAISFLLSTPQLWCSLTVFEWTQIFAALSPRPDSFKADIFDSGYVDIYFLCKYVKVNAISFFLANSEFSIKDKVKVLQYFKKIQFYMFANELELEDLDGCYFVSIDVLKETRNKLLTTKGFQPFDFTADEFKEYLEISLTQYF